MKKISKKYIIIIIFLIFLGILAYKYKDKFFPTNSQSGDVEFGTIETIVEKKSFDSEIELNGTTKIKNEQNIKFNTSGKITEVNFKVGDEVKQKDRIVAIEATKAYSEIEKAEIDLDKARRNLSKIVEELKDSRLKNAILDLKSAKLNIEKKELNLAFLRDKQAQDLKSKQNELEIAKNQYVIDDAKLKKDLAISKYETKDKGNSLDEKNLNYEKQKREYEKAKENLNYNINKKINDYNLKLENAYNELEKDIMDFKKSLEEMESIIGVGNSYFTYEKYFSVKNSLNIGKIRDYYYKANEAFKKLEEAFKKIESKKDYKNILEALKKSKDFYENAYYAYTYLDQGFNDSVAVEGFEPSSYASKFSPFLSRASNMRTNISNIIDELNKAESPEKIEKDLKQELEKQKIEIENMEIEISKFLNEKDFGKETLNASQKNILISLEELKTALERKKLEFEKYKKSLDDEYNEEKISLEKDKLALKNLEKELEKLKNIGKNEEYLAAEESVKQAELNLENSKKQLENFVIVAPFDGILTKIDYKVGDRITENSDSKISIVDPKTIEILVSINQNDIVKVRKGMKAEITLDSYPDKILNGVLTEIETTPKNDNQGGPATFPAKVLISDFGDLNLYSGMNANVKLKVSSIPESLVVPFSAVNSDDDGKKYVSAIENGKKVKKYVEVGEAVGNYYQILNGLKEGEKILEVDYDASKIKADENFGPALEVK